MLRGIRDSPEVRSVLRESPALRLLLQPRFWRDAFDYMDTGNTGVITFPEFERTVTAGNEESIRRAALRRVFDLLDTNGNGTLEKAELLRGIRDSDSVRRVLRANPALHRLLVSRIWKKSFNAMDTKGRAGEVSFDEFELFVGGGGEHTALRECFHVLGGSDIKSVPISRAMMMLGGVGGEGVGRSEEVRTALRRCSALKPLLGDDRLCLATAGAETEVPGVMSLNEWLALALGARGARAGGVMGIREGLVEAYGGR